MEMTATTEKKAPTRDQAVAAWEHAVYTRRHVLTHYGPESRQFARAKAAVIAAWADVERAIPAGSPCVVRGRRFEWVEGELQVSN